MERYYWLRKLYEVSSLGRVRSKRVDRIVENGVIIQNAKREKYFSLNPDKSIGYVKVNLYNELGAINKVAEKLGISKTCAWRYFKLYNIKIK